MDARMKPRISDAERAARRRDVDAARGSVRLEGFILSAEVEAISERYVNGELTAEEHVAAVKAAVAGG